MIKCKKLFYYRYQLLEDYFLNTKIKPPTNIYHPFIILFKSGRICINKGYAWNGASGPVFNTYSFRRSSLVHDAFCQLIAEGLLDRKWRKEADILLKIISLEDGMFKFRAWYVFKIVRLYVAIKNLFTSNKHG